MTIEAESEETEEHNSSSEAGFQLTKNKNVAHLPAICSIKKGTKCTVSKEEEQLASGESLHSRSSLYLSRIHGPF